MVLRLKTRESRSLPGLLKAMPQNISGQNNLLKNEKLPSGQTPETGDAGWSSPVARQAHNLKAAGSNPAPATNKTRNRKPISRLLRKHRLAPVQIRLSGIAATTRFSNSARLIVLLLVQTIPPRWSIGSFFWRLVQP
jgi:hypothetical protein